MQPPNLDKFKKYFNRHNNKQSIQEIVREPTAGGIVFRRNKKGEVEILLIQDHKDRWTIPKGHIEEGETAQEAARREIGEEAGLHDIDMLGWLGKIHFRYRRIEKLVLITQQVYLMRVRTSGNEIQKEDWMNAKWRPMMGWLYMATCTFDFIIFAKFTQIYTGYTIFL